MAARKSARPGPKPRETAVKKSSVGKKTASRSRPKDGLTQAKRAPAKSPARKSRALRRARRIPEFKLDEWSQFEATVRRELGDRELVVRNFDLATFDGIETKNPVEVDSLEVVRRTGTDRRPNADVWNATGFDHDHDLQPTGKMPNEVTYAFWVDFRCTPYKASEAQGDGTALMKTYDITRELDETHGIVIYDPAHLSRKSANEYWFLTTALDAVLLVLTIREP